MSADEPGSEEKLPKLAYLIITIGCAVTAISLYIYGYNGYSGLVLAIGIASAVNLKN